MTLRLLTAILILFVAQGHAAEKTPPTNPLQQPVEVTLSLVGQKIANVGGKNRIQRDDFKLQASVTGLPPGANPLYQFRLQVTRKDQEPKEVATDFTPGSEHLFSKDEARTADIVNFFVTVRIASPRGNIDRTAEIGPYLVILDWFAVDMFTRHIAPTMRHPRCLNCHVSGDSPTQGDDRHMHLPPVNRQVVCTQCHGITDGTTPGSPPGAPNWRMPPAEFSFVNKSPAQLCRQLKDPAQTGGRSLDELVEHVKSDPIIAWATRDAAPERAIPPASDGWEIFAYNHFPAWVNAGAACPDEEPSSPKPSRSAATAAPLNKPQTDSCCTIVPNPQMRGRLGRLVITYPDGAETSGTRVDVYKAGETKAIADDFGSYTLELFPGSYDVVISGKRVGGVTVKSAHDTNVKVGVLRITADKNTRVELIDPTSGKGLTGDFGSRDYGLPIGTVNVKILGQAETVTITEGKITDF